MKISNVWLMPALCLFVAVTASLSAFAEGRASKENAIAASRNIVVVSAEDNVQSNYYDDVLLSENTGISQDSISEVYNRVIEDNLKRAAKDYIINIADDAPEWKDIVGKIRLDKGENGSVSSLSEISPNELAEALSKSEARYLLVIDSHYLDYREKPMPMMYHYVNFSLYDAGGRKISSNQTYFPAYEPQNRQKMKKSSLKGTQKVMEQLEKTLQKLPQDDRLFSQK